MELRERQADTVFIVEIEGKLDSKTSDELEKSLVSAIDKGAVNIILDCAHLDYISSAGLRVILLAAKKLRPVSGKVALTSLKDYVREVFEIAGFAPILPMYTDTEQALNEIK